MKLTELAIGKTLFIGVIIAAIFVTYGGIGYLLRDGTTILQSKEITVQPASYTLSGVVVALQQHNPQAYIVFGIILLFVIQLLRVAMASLIFLSNKEYINFAFSIFVFLVLTAAILLNA
ncbi:MAG TPA: DUF1634 domain-containing protein [Gammaproteobacteria bacterium]|nr:DUF1634 domain-containing protein [Gammaproteobacteria bacterium]